MRSWTSPATPRVILTVLICLLAVAPGFAQQQGAAGTAAEQAAAETLAEVRKELAKLLGLPEKKLLPDVDLTKNPGIDHGTLHYKLQRLYALFEVKPPAKELTVLRQIAAHIDTGEELLGFAPEMATRGGARSSGSDAEFFVQKVYFATNRKRTGRTEPDEFFGPKPVDGQQLHYGLASVNIPRSHRRGRLETPWLGIKRFRNPAKHIYISGKLEILDPETFYATLGSEGNGKEPLLIYIHGFNVDFSEAVARAAQIAFDLDFAGVPIAFSWPSNGKLNPVAYRSDLADVEFSVDYVERFLVSLRKKFPDRAIHAIAHSMGAKALTYAMRNLARRGHKGRMFGSVILAAPDVDARLFTTQIAGEIKYLAAHWAIYASKLDFVLNISGYFSDTPRLGVPLTMVEGMQIIDASKIQVTPWSVPERHGYYATKKKVIDDMISVLKGLLPHARGLTAENHHGRTAWAFK